jgi:adenylate cyclase
VIFANHGTFDKYLGDSVMAFWGAPVASDEDAFRAVKAAVEMRDVFAQVCARQGGDMARLGLGIGLNSGEATVGNIGSEKMMDYTVIGDTVNVAARLQSQASSGDVLISEATYQLVKDRIRTEWFEPIAVHGRNEPVVVYSVKELIA